MRAPQIFIRKAQSARYHDSASAPTDCLFQTRQHPQAAEQLHPPCVFDAVNGGESEEPEAKGDIITNPGQAEEALAATVDRAEAFA